MIATKTTGWTAGDSAVNDLTMMDNQWVCFKAKNSKGVYGYAKLQTDLTRPVVTLTQNNSTITASGDDLTDFKYYIPNALTPKLIRIVLLCSDFRLYIRDNSFNVS